MTSISKLEGVDTSYKWKLDGVKVETGPDDHALFQHEADAEDAIVAHGAIDDTLALVEAAKILVAIADKDPSKIHESAAFQAFRSATAKFTP